MYYRVKGTRTPKLEVGLSVEEVQQLDGALTRIMAVAARSTLTDNQFSALTDLRRHLGSALNTDLPHGIKGCEP